MAADAPPSTLREFFGGVGDADLSLVTVNRTHPEQVQGLVRDAFGTQRVELAERDLPAEGENVVLLLRDGEIAATSSLDQLMRTFLLVNSDGYRTGVRGFEGEELPDVLMGMDERLFDLRGYPASNKEKLLLILVSRHIERRAYEASTGSLRSTFQRLSRLDDEYGTRRVYESLASTPGLDVHVYGVPDADPSLDLTVHRGTSDEYRNSWCVVFAPRPDGEGEGAALVALQSERNRWQGFWTYDPDRVRRIDAYLDAAF
ncbi:MAG: histidine kinase [Haloplanus sp.]